MIEPVAIAAEQVAGWNSELARVEGFEAKILGAWISRLQACADGEIYVELILLLSNGQVLRPRGRFPLSASCNELRQRTIN